MQSAYIEPFERAQPFVVPPRKRAHEPFSALRGESVRGGGGAAYPVISPPLSEKRGYPPRNRNPSCSRPELSGLSGGIERARRERRRAHSGICASRSNSRSDWRRAASAKRILRNDPRRNCGATRTSWFTDWVAA